MTDGAINSNVSCNMHPSFFLALSIRVFIFYFKSDHVCVLKNAAEGDIQYLYVPTRGGHLCFWFWAHLFYLEQKWDSRTCTAVVQTR